MQWTNEEQQALVEIKKQCLYGLYVHSRSACINHLINNALVVPNIIIGSVLSVSLFTTSTGPWKTAGGALALTSTILTGVTKHIGAAEKSQLHCLVVREYQRLIQDINIYLHTPVDNPMAIIQALRNDIEKIIGLQPDPSVWVLYRFDKVHRKRFESMMVHDFEKIMLHEASNVHRRISNQRLKHSSEGMAFE